MQGFPPYRTPGTEARGETYNSSYLLADFLGSAAHTIRGLEIEKNFRHLELLIGGRTISQSIELELGTQSLPEVIFKRKG